MAQASLSHYERGGSPQGAATALVRIVSESSNKHASPGDKRIRTPRRQRLHFSSFSRWLTELGSKARLSWIAGVILPYCRAVHPHCGPVSPRCRGGFHRIGGAFPPHCRGTLQRAPTDGRNARFRNDRVMHAITGKMYPNPVGAKMTGITGEWRCACHRTSNIPNPTPLFITNSNFV